MGSMFNVFDTLGIVDFLQHSKIVVKELGMDPKVHIWNGEGGTDTIICIGFAQLQFYLDDHLIYIFLKSSEPNPHMGHLAWADVFVVTADSVSMLSEACSTGYV